VNSLGRLLRSELHSLLGAAGAAFGLNAHSTTVLAAGAAYAVAMKGLAILSSSLEKKLAKSPAEEAAVSLTASEVSRLLAEEATRLGVATTPGLQSGAA
jgi:hypothetical protein